MSFLEDLRRQRELKAKELEDAQQFARAEADQQSVLLAKAEDQRNRLELEKRNQVERQLKQAKEYFAKSDFVRLSKELSPEVGGIVSSDYVGDEQNRSVQFGIKLRWNEHEENRHKEDGKLHTFKVTVYDEVYNFITVGCDPLGTIILSKSWGDIKLPMSKWLGNPAIQEEALGRAYHHPKRHSTRHNSDYDDYPSSSLELPHGPR